MGNCPTQTENLAGKRRYRFALPKRNMALSLNTSVSSESVSVATGFPCTLREVPVVILTLEIYLGISPVKRQVNRRDSSCREGRSR